MKFRLFSQMVFSIGIIVFVPNALIQTALLFLVWVITFQRLTYTEILLFVITCFFFTIADVIVTNKGIFNFTHPDILNIPYYEFFVWGFYFLHTARLLGGRVVRDIGPGLIFAGTFTLPLSVFEHPTVILVSMGVTLCLGLLYFRTKYDFYYTWYLVFIGCIIEYIGTVTGTWYYGIEHYYAWWVITWGGSGLILYRTLIPVSTYCARLLKKS